MKMKKIYFISLTLLVILVLTACGPKDTRPVLRYAAWNLGTEEQNNIERRLIKAYQEENPNIRIEIIPRPAVVNEDGEESEVGWFDFFSTNAANGTLPDVFQVADLTSWIIQGWVEDISDLALEDEDLKLVPEDIVNNTRYDGKLLALPQSMFYYGFFINRTAYEDIRGNKEVNYGITFDELMEAASKNFRRDLETGGTGVAGISGMNALIEWLPAQYDDSLDWFTFNEEDGYHLDSDAFATAINKQMEYYPSNEDASNKNYLYVLDALIDDDKILQYNTTSPWGAGKQSIIWSQSYNIRDWIGSTLDPNHPLYMNDIDFIGTPKIGDTHKIPVIMDYIAVGRGSQVREEAYDFARYMGYGIDGFKKRIEIAKEHPEAGAINFAPMAQDEELIDLYFSLYPSMTEFRKVVEEHKEFINESLWKTTPGYWDSRSNAGYDENQNIGEVINKILHKELILADVVVNLNKAANDAWEREKIKLDNALNSYYKNN